MRPKPVPGWVLDRPLPPVDHVLHGDWVCWVPRIKPQQSGYVRRSYMIDGRSLHFQLHRVFYAKERGDSELWLDHLCRNRACVHPSHLELVTLGENVLRGDSVCARRARSAECDKGHTFTVQNTARTSDGYRLCRICKRVRERGEKQRATRRRIYATARGARSTP